ncbi:MAG: hypothetical protein IJY12_03555 [Clostridia bacterium]|nr:hypothetical protein [Clostridia bacterium]
MEIFGPSAWLEGMYLAALKAAAEMAEYFGETETAEQYRAIFENGYAYTREHLFNGKYFIHQVDIRDKSYTEHFGCPNYWNEEKGQLKYQIGEGCEINQLLGQWHATLCGLGDIFDPEQRKTALYTMYQTLFKPSMREVANAWRVFALNDEGGAIICDYPEGAERPIIPIPYSDECMTGFEYAFAGLLIREGFREEGLTIIRAIRDRYDGKKRNPWNEIECGSNYARAMASFALLPIFSGFTYDMVEGYMGFAPIDSGDFRCFWSLGNAWGDFIRDRDGCQILVHGGAIALRSIRVGDMGEIRRVYVDGTEVSYRQDGDTVCFDRITVTNKIEMRFS